MVRVWGCLVRWDLFHVKRRQIILVGLLQFFLQTRSLCCLFCWVLPQQYPLGVPKGSPLCLLFQGVAFIKESNYSRKLFTLLQLINKRKINCLYLHSVLSKLSIMFDSRVIPCQVSSQCSVQRLLECLIRKKSNLL